VVVLWLVAASGWAQTLPFATEEADTGPKGLVRFELAGAVIGDEPNFLTGGIRTTWDGPLLRLVLAPADNVELDVEWTAAVGALDDPDFGNVTDWGDVALRAKVRLAGQDARCTRLAARMQITLPETDADHGLGPNTLRMAVDLLFSRPLGPFELHANAGMAVQDQVQELVSQDDFFAYGLAVLGQVGAGLSLGIEVAGLAGKGSPGTDAHHEARFGARYGPGRWQLAAAVRRGLGDADGRWGAVAGLSVRLH
jgi:hypothetical protein